MLRSKQILQPGERIRVLVVDDSVVIRRLVTHALAEDQEIEVSGSAANGRLALERIPLLKPDVVTLDIEMPEMNGLETLAQIRKLHPQVRVIMFSTLTDRGAAVTMEALTLGANDYVTKAANVGSLDKSMDALRSELIPKIKQFFLFPEAGGKRQPVDASANLKLAATPFTAPRKSEAKPEIVVIGVSTGGPNALAAMIPAFPANFQLPVLIVQHMPAVFTRLLAERLNALTPLDVMEASEGTELRAGRILIAPGDYHMGVERIRERAVVRLNQNAPENSCRPAVDVLFRSASEQFGAATIAAVLTGMGQDGAAGAKALRAKGAFVVVQDEASSVVWGMPGAVAKAGLAHAVVPLAQIVPVILKQL